MCDVYDRSEFLKKSMLVLAGGTLIAGGVRAARAQVQTDCWEAVLGKVKELNEKAPVLVKAQFKDAEGQIMEEEKVYVRWEKLNKNTGRWIVLSAFCTHLKCVIEFDADAGLFQCPCHGSQFDLTGQVLERPAKYPLADYSELAEEREGELILTRDAR